MPKRKSLSKKLRFEVFKRDNFKCQYCGSTPPEVVLEIDHIKPVSKGGGNDINNLITACFNCNRGKTNIELKKITPALSENLEILKQKEDQLKEYNKYLRKIKTRVNREITKIDNIYKEYFDGWVLSDKFKKHSVAMFLKKLPLCEVEEAMEKSCYVVNDADESIKYFCGICWNKIKSANNG